MLSPCKKKTRRSAVGRVPLGPGQYEAANLDTTVADDLVEMMKEFSIVDPNDPNVETETIDWVKERDLMDRYFDSAVHLQLKNLPAYHNPGGFKRSTKLLPHQKDGVRWLLHQENDPPMNPFYREVQKQDGTLSYRDRFTGRGLEQPYSPVKGAVLADEMGLGKTVQALGLVLSNPPPPPVANKWSPTCTLVLCPKSVISTWLLEIEKFVEPDALRVVVFDGTPNQRSKIIHKVRDNQVDLLLATYTRVSNDYGTAHAVNGWGYPLLELLDVPFYRVILDEAQEIRNVSSNKYKGVMEIANKAQYRVALTGTPFVNDPVDIHSLLSFVGLEPWNDHAYFKDRIADPIRDRKKHGLTKLRAALTHVAFRRTKGVAKKLKLVPKYVQLNKVDFVEGDHKAIYDFWFEKAKNAFQAAELEPSLDVARTKFTMQLRLRQSCASGALAVPEEASSGGISVNAPAPKIRALLMDIDAMKEDEKGVIFSQWNSFLDIAATELTKEGHTFVRIDGSTSQEARTKAMKALNEDPSIRFILCSLRAAGCGINLTRANVVFMMDPWWNDATEMQAVDRCHRVGQTRSVRVYRYVMKNSIEERMVTNIQEAKKKLGKGAMAKLTSEELKLAKIVTLKDLFGVGFVDDGEEEVDDESNQDWE